MKELITIKITKEEYDKIAYALHYTSCTYDGGFASLRHKKFNDVRSFQHIKKGVVD